MGKVVFGTLLLNSLLLSADIYETIFDGNCGSCHTIKDSSSAPLITEVIKIYKANYPKKKDFIKALSSWVYNPNKDNSLFPKAIKHYGLMPELGIDKETLSGIASYLYSFKNNHK